MKSRILALSALCAILLTGCVGTGVSGKTHYDLKWDGEVFGQDKQSFSVSVKAPAGDLVKVLADMGYTWNADGSGFVKVGSKSDLDSTGQAEMIATLAQIQRDALTSALQIAAPIAQARAEQPDSPDTPKFTPEQIRQITELVRTVLYPPDGRP